MSWFSNDSTFDYSIESLIYFDTYIWFQKLYLIWSITISERYLIWLLLWFSKNGFWNVRRRFCTSNAHNFLILNRIDPKLVSEPSDVGKCTYLSSLDLCAYGFALLCSCKPQYVLHWARARICYRAYSSALFTESLVRGPGMVYVYDDMIMAPSPMMGRVRYMCTWFHLPSPLMGRVRYDFIHRVPH